MKKILFISSTYLPQPNAVGVCVEAIASEFENRGYETYVVTMSDGPEYDYIGHCHVYNVPVPVIKQSKIVLFRKIMTGYRLIRDYPLENDNYKKIYLEKIEELIKDNTYEMIICAQKPAVAAWFGMEIKKRYPKQKIVLYELDSITDNNSSYYGYTKYLKHRNFALEKKVYESVDAIIHMDSHRDFYEQEKYEKYKEKSRYVGIPLLDKRLYYQKEGYRAGDKRKCIYAGMLYSSIRQPYYVVKLIQALDREINVHFDFFTHGEFDQFLKEKEKETSGSIAFCGYVNKDVLDEELKEADFLLNIGNLYPQKTGAVPSKLFSYISTGKPIIHISPNDLDTSLPYLEKYPNVLIIRQNDSLKDNVEKFNDFLKKSDYSLAKWDMLEEIFIQNTSKYTVDKIINCIL